MIRLHLTVEGETEKRFIKRVLAEHLSNFGVAADARCVLTSKDRRTDREYRGGFRIDGKAYETVRKDILSWMKNDRDDRCRFSTMFDVYGLPPEFPGMDEAKRHPDPYPKVLVLEDAFAADINDRRFMPYLQLHEFETLIFADPSKLACEYLQHLTEISRLRDMASGKNPELINENPKTAPSKRIRKEIPEYDKAVVGPIVAAEIGVDTLKQRCRHFHDWLTRLENLNPNFSK